MASVSTTYTCHRKMVTDGTKNFQTYPLQKVTFFSPLKTHIIFLVMKHSTNSNENFLKVKEEPKVMDRGGKWLSESPIWLPQPVEWLRVQHDYFYIKGWFI